MTEHISKGFDENLDEVNDLVLTMGGLALSQLHAVLASVDHSDEAALENLIAGDAKIDAMEIALNSKAMEVIALRSPVAKDLRCVFVAIKMAQILERIGDYAANIAKRTIKRAKEDENSTINAEMNILGMMAHAMLVDALDAYRHLDDEKALSVWGHDVHLDERYNTINHAVVIAMEKGAVSAAGGMQYLFVLKDIERIGDYATGIAEQVYFLIHGAQIETSRPKA